MPEFSRRGAAGAAPAGTPLACRRISAHSHHRGRSPGSACPSAPGRSACPAAPTGTAPWKDPEQGPCSTALVKHGAHQGLSSEGPARLPRPAAPAAGTSPRQGLSSEGPAQRVVTVGRSSGSRLGRRGCSPHGIARRVDRCVPSVPREIARNRDGP